MTELPCGVAGRIYPQDSLKSYPAKTDDHLWTQNLDFPLQIQLTVVQLIRGWLVIGRGATPGRRDVHVLQEKTIASRLSRGLVREPGAVQRREQEIPRRIARELTPRPVRAVRAGGKTNDQDTRLRVAESRHRFAPVILVDIRLALDARHFPAPRHQPRTFPAGNDLSV